MKVNPPAIDDKEGARLTVLTSDRSHSVDPLRHTVSRPLRLPSPLLPVLPLAEGQLLSYHNYLEEAAVGVPAR